MQLMFRTRNGSCLLDWSHYALLRDNVQHYLESGPERGSFQALHAVERAIDGEPRYLHALDLRRELERAWAALGNLPLSESAISLRTRDVLSHCGSPTFVRGTFKAKAMGWRLPVDGDRERPLSDYLGEFVEALLGLTDLPASVDDLCVARVEQTRTPSRRHL